MTNAPIVEQSDPAAAAALLAGASAALFDFNGTLSLDEDLFEAIYRQIAADLGYVLSATEYAERFVGHADPEIARDLAELAGRTDAEAAILDEVAARYADRIRLDPRIPGAYADYVRRLAASGVRIAIVTGALRATVEPALDAAGLTGSVELLLAAEDVTRGKPDPEPFLLATRLLGLTAGEVVGVEDSDAGMRSLAAAGIAAIRVGAPYLDLAEIAAIGVR